ncbi:MAG: glutaredoxin family protein [Candidatus Doudnabacteria bacterium]|nr:glutaredoxin family protein [Candidatus Doudnabacteria bacterium]
MRVTIYTTKTCPYCKMAKQYFAQNNVQYEEKDVTTDAALAQEMIDKSGQMGVPVILIDDQVVVGFDKPRLQELLA